MGGSRSGSSPLRAGVAALRPLDTVGDGGRRVVEGGGEAFLDFAGGVLEVRMRFEVEGTVI